MSNISNVTLSTEIYLLENWTCAIHGKHGIEGVLT